MLKVLYQLKLSIELLSKLNESVNSIPEGGRARQNWTNKILDHSCVYCISKRVKTYILGRSYRWYNRRAPKHRLTPFTVVLS